MDESIEAPGAASCVLRSVRWGWYDRHHKSVSSPEWSLNDPRLSYCGVRSMISRRRHPPYNARRCRSPATAWPGLGFCFRLDMSYPTGCRCREEKPRTDAHRATATPSSRQDLVKVHATPSADGAVQVGSASACSTKRGCVAAV